MDSFINTFHVDWKIIIAQLINFVIVLFVLKILLYKPLNKMMRDRTETIEGGLKDAKDNAVMIENTKKEYDKMILQARSEAKGILQESKTEAESNKAQIIEKTQKEVDEMIANGKKILVSEKAKIIDEAKQEIVSLVVLATEKLLESHSTEKIDEAAINQIKKM